MLEIDNRYWNIKDIGEHRFIAIDAFLLNKKTENYKFYLPKNNLFITTFIKTILVGQIEGKNLRYCRTIPFCFHIVPRRLVSTFLYVGRVKISCLLLPTRSSWNFVLNSITVKKCEISNTFLTQITYIIWKLAKNYI
jgi:hypothetical protein